MSDRDKTLIFEDFQIDPDRSLLVRVSDGQPVPITHKAFQILRILLESRGDLVPKSELMERVWQDTFVEEANLTQTISMLRKALGENPSEHRFIVTESGKGYRFVAPVTELNGNGSSVSNDGIVPVQAAAIDPRAKYRIAVTLGILALAVASIGFYFIRNAVTPAAPPVSTTDVRSIAVLPFRAIESNDDSSLGTGMADAVIARLSRLKSIVVRQTSNLLRNGEATPEAVRIGRQVNVDAVLEGTIQRASDDRIRVAVRMFRVGDGALLWADNFDERETDIFALQDAIAERVAHALSIQLSASDEQNINLRSTDNLEAYHLYNKGRYFWNRRNTNDLHKSIDFYEQAIAKDPNYALAYAGMAESYVLLQKYSQSYESDAFPKAKVAAEKALSLDPNLSEGHAALGLYKEQYDWNWSEAESEFKKAIAANPNYATAHQWYGEFLAFRGRTSESIAEIDTALQLDPLSLSTNAARAFPYLADRQYDDVIDKIQPALELNADFPQALYYLARAYEGRGEFDKAVATYERAIKVTGGSSFFASAMINSLAKAGKKDRAERVLTELLNSDRTQPVSRYILARGMAALGKTEEAFSALDDAFANRDPLLAVIRVDPNFDLVTDDPRFQNALRKVGY